MPNSGILGLPSDLRGTPEGHSREELHPSGSPETLSHGTGIEESPFTILYFGNDWTGETRTSSHHIARWLAKSHKVYYLDCPGIRTPNGSSRDLRKLLTKLARFLRGPRLTAEGLQVWTLLQFPFHRFRFVRWLNRKLIGSAIGWLKVTQGLRASISWFTVPHLAPVAGHLSEQLVVYYCVDDYSAYPGVNPEAVRSMDEEMTRKADVVFVVSETLLATKRELNCNTHLSPHGVEADHFSQARCPGPVPEEVASLYGPVVGYFGSIEKWFDMELLDWLAAQRPEWNFVLIGRVGLTAAELSNRPNVHFLGRRPYEELPHYGRRFDAAIIPSRLDHRFAQHASPLKLREYLAMGVPVVATPTPENRKFGDVISLAKDREQFLAHLERAIDSPMTLADAQKRMSRVADTTWEARARDVLSRVRTHLRRKDTRSVAQLQQANQGLFPPSV